MGISFYRNLFQKLLTKCLVNCIFVSYKPNGCTPCPLTDHFYTAHSVRFGQGKVFKKGSMDAVQLDFFADDQDNSPMLLSALGDGIQNDCGVYTKNVLEFREGLLPHNYVCVRLCAEGDFIIFEFSYQAGTYGCGHPLCRPCHECHRKNSALFLAECIYNVFQHSVVPYDKNLVKYPKETKELLKLCRKLCDRIAKEVV